MNTFFIICTSLTIFSATNGQQVQYAGRFRNFSIESETDAGHLINMRIYQDKSEHKIALTFNLTKDIHIKNIEVIIYRCSFEKFYCENFQKWKFTQNVKSIVFMKNQIWTPLLEHMTPKPDVPFVKKNVYKIPDGTLNPKAIVMLYPEAANYFWRGDISMNDFDNKQALIIKIEFVVFTFVGRNRKNNGGGTPINNTTKIPE